MANQMVRNFFAPSVRILTVTYRIRHSKKPSQVGDTFLLIYSIFLCISIMFACIFFKEDASLSVVGRSSKKLVLKGQFQQGDEVEMEWPVSGKKRALYHGTIIVTGGKSVILCLCDPNQMAIREIHLLQGLFQCPYSVS